MKTQRLSTRTLAVMVVIASVIWTLSAGMKIKEDPCCVKVSADEVTDPIIGYRLQKENLPCVKSVILETQRGNLCINPGAPWVLKKLRQFRAQKQKLTPTTVVQHVTSRPPPTSSSSSISNITHVGGSNQTNHSQS